MCIQILWTGGWDSTFRLLYLLRIEKKEAQPHYIVTGQKSTGKEIATMYSLIRDIYGKYPGTRKLLKPIILKDAMGVEPNEKITNLYLQIKKRKKINAQYELFARYCRQIDKKIEICCEPDLDGLKIDYFNTGNLFDKYFYYPLLSTNKKQMANISSENDWTEIMSRTWFCRIPKRGKPCGLCGPCTDLLLAGLESRLPFKPRLIARIQLPFRKFWRHNYHNQSTAPFKFIYKMFSGRV